MADNDDAPEGSSASPARRNTPRGAAKASNGEIVPGTSDDVEAAEAPAPASRRGAEPTGLTRVEKSGSAEHD